MAMMPWDTDGSAWMCAAKPEAVTIRVIIIGSTGIHDGPLVAAVLA